MFSSPFENQAPQPQEKWRLHVDWFVQDYQPQLAALVWGLQQEWGNDGTILGIDLQPQPHFIPCSPESLQTLNKRVGGRIQEILGIIKGADTNKETIILCIGGGQVKLIYFEAEPSPAGCFETHGQDIDKLITDLETVMAETIKLESATK
ncbi:hypothetical protein Lepto7376_0560 [[Leptolyngbya] sp. PCC 7376]|uniref:beta-carboxysome assembly chaperone CcmS n=1 Tax=[Leptolyngbya] sp. PCC 7376 TaxID=111781 RepID=UPI00029F41C6|nr:hypothetical protein [[Leptolyngbya] sp. PCC 7376]AFY36986.1 hypothetical protein Lepto7376_0560 [[Leptolyngbya] sp. PCC 7376]